MLSGAPGVPRLIFRHVAVTFFIRPPKHQGWGYRGLEGRVEHLYKRLSHLESRHDAILA